MQIVAETLDDLLRKLFPKLLRSTIRTNSSKGPARELIGTIITLEDPRARFSRTESRSPLFSCIGELLWYLSGRNDIEFIKYYISAYAGLTDDKLTANGAYGPRLFDLDGVNQMKAVIDMLKAKRDTRQAVIQIFRASDLGKRSLDVPCTCAMQFFVRRGELHMFTTMRSNDAYIGLPHDVFAFTMIQEVIARSISCGLGSYHHSVGSLHLYDKNVESARRYLKEGVQKSWAMPPMPIGDPWPSIAWLHKVEERIRLGDRREIESANIDPYWVDLARILRIKALLAEKKKREIVAEKNKMHFDVYDAFIRDKERSILVEATAPQLPLPGLTQTQDSSGALRT